MMPEDKVLKMVPVTELKDDSRIIAMYRSAFPKIEQLPYAWLKLISRFRARDFFAFTQNGTAIAHAFLINGKECALLYYFAVDETKRGEGIGSESLRLLKQHYSIPLVVIMKPTDPDASDRTLRLRRKAFYERAGFSYTGMTVTDWSGSFSVFSTGIKPDKKALYRMLKRFTPWDRKLRVDEDCVHE